MQGRLSPMPGEAMQFFPKHGWQDEFGTASALGLDEVELVFDGPPDDHPLFDFPEKVDETARVVGISIKSILADYFIDEPLTPANSWVLKNLIQIAAGMVSNTLVDLIEIPFIEKSSMKNMDANSVMRALSAGLDEAEKWGIRLGLETDLSPGEMKKFLDGFHHPLLGANYDSGNSSAAGFKPADEIPLLGEKIFNVHVKDRPLGGATTALGTGGTDFAAVALMLDGVKYSGSLVLQAARSPDGDEKACVLRQIEFVKRVLEHK